MNKEQKRALLHFFGVSKEAFRKLILSVYFIITVMGKESVLGEKHLLSSQAW